MAEAIKTLKASGGNYTDPETWWAVECASYDCVANATSPVLEGYDDWVGGLSKATTVMNVLTGYTANSLHHPVFRAAPGQGHTGIPNTGFGLKSTSWASKILESNASYMEFAGVELIGGNANRLSFNADYQHYHHLIVHGSMASGFEVRGSHSCHHNIIMHSTTDGYVGKWLQSGVEVNNCVAINCARYGFNHSSNTPTATNCIASGCGTGGFSAGLTGDNNASDDATAPGANSFHGITASEFVDAANDDYHLSSTSILRGAGANLYTDGSDVDIDGDVWPNAAWDIGFDYYVAGGGSSTYSIAGDVTISSTPAATTDYQQHPAISGDVSITATPAAVLDKQQHPAITGDSAITVTPAAVMGFGSGYTVVGDVSISATPSATLSYSQHHAIAGSVTTSITPAATLSQQSHHAITGDVAASVTPASTLYFGSGDYIQGDVTISATPSGMMSFTRHAAIAGNVAVNLTPAAILDITRHHAITGDVSVTAVPASVLGFTTYVPLSLSQNDLDAIAEAVRLMLVDQGCFTKIDEIWTRLGLNPAAPLTNHTDGGITATGIDIEASSDGDNIVQTRQ
jgi:hypothetical protein